MTKKDGTKTGNIEEDPNRAVKVHQERGHLKKVLCIFIRDFILSLEDRRKKRSSKYSSSSSDSESSSDSRSRSSRSRSRSKSPYRERIKRKDRSKFDKPPEAGAMKAFQMEKESRFSEKPPVNAPSQFSGPLRVSDMAPGHKINPQDQGNVFPSFTSKPKFEPPGDNRHAKLH